MNVKPHAKNPQCMAPSQKTEERFTCSAHVYYTYVYHVNQTIPEQLPSHQAVCTHEERPENEDLRGISPGGQAFGRFLIC